MFLFLNLNCTQSKIISYHIISYHIISYHIISYHTIPYHTTPCHTIYHIISYLISYHIIYHINIIYHITSYHIDGLGQDCSNSSALAMELLQSCTKPSISHHITYRIVSHRIISHRIVPYRIFLFIVIAGCEFTHYLDYFDEAAEVIRNDPQYQYGRPFHHILTGKCLFTIATTENNRFIYNYVTLLIMAIKSERYRSLGCMYGFVPMKEMSLVIPVRTVDPVPVRTCCITVTRASCRFRSGNSTVCSTIPLSYH